MGTRFSSPQRESSDDIKTQFKIALSRIPVAKMDRIRQVFDELVRQSSISGGRVDKASFLRYFPLPGMMGERLFAVFDRDGSGSIDFQEFVTGLSLIYHGTVEEKKRFLFDMYDLDGNGEISKDELFTMLSYIPSAFRLLQFSSSTPSPTDDDEKLHKIVESVFSSTSGQTLSFSEFQIAVANNSAVSEIINIFYNEALPENEAGLSGAIKSCPLCETNVEFLHCVSCGGSLLPHNTACERCGQIFPEILFCFACGHPLKPTLQHDNSSDSESASDGNVSVVAGVSIEDSADGCIVSGYLSKIGKTTLTRQTRYFVLKDSFLYYYSNMESANTGRPPKGVIFLPGVFVGAIGEKEFFLKSGKKRRNFYTVNKIDQSKWISALTKATKTRSVYDYYILNDTKESECIGRGKFSSVFRASNTISNEQVAIKKISITHEEDREFIRTELAIVKLVVHTNIVKTIDVFESVDSIYIVMERVDGGDLLHRLNQVGKFSEFEAQRTILPLLHAIQYIHEKGIIHRDIKPENILICSDGGVKLTDFGLSAIAPHHSKTLEAPLGTVNYAAPEVLLSRPYDKSVDMWSLGAVCFVMLCGKMPFKGHTDKETAQSVLKVKYSFGNINVSDSAKDFIGKLLVKNPTMRMTAQQALEHDWLAAFIKPKNSVSALT